jgi:hypothetical protein
MEEDDMMEQAQFPCQPDRAINNNNNADDIVLTKS